MANPRIFQVQSPPMKGKDIKDWQQEIKTRFKKDFGIDCPIKMDGVYGQATRSFSAALVHAEGLSIRVRMSNGVTPELREMIHKGTEPAQAKKTRASKSRKDYRAKLKKQWALPKVHSPVSRIIADSWGWHPGVHDGLDVISIEGSPAMAMVKSKIIDVRSGGWWGKSPSGDISRGDGIVQMEVLESVGPFKKGMHIGYGHCEHARVKVGQIVQAGETVALVGFAVAAHIHLMVNNGKTTRGVGTQDPRPLLNYAVKNG